MLTRAFPLLLALALPCAVLAQAPPAQAPATTTLADDLGYPPGTRLLIIHADDLGMANSVNAASFEAMTEGSVNSASVMMPTPWAMQVAAFAKTHPDADLGIHLTLTSEWRDYRWGPSAYDSVATLLDTAHYFHHGCMDMAAGASAEEVRGELRAQIEQAYRLGIDPTHLDTHMSCLAYARADLTGVYLGVGREYDLPVLLERDVDYTPEQDAYFLPSDMIVDRVAGPISTAPTESLRDEYDKLITGLAPGVSVLLLHCGYDDTELKAAMAPQELYGAAWRQMDTDYFTSAHLPELLERENIQLVTWRELYARWKARDDQPGAGHSR